MKMKRIGIILVFQLLILFNSAPIVQADSSINIPFGTTLQSVEGDMQWVAQDPSYGGIGFYQRKDAQFNKLEYGGTPLTAVFYGFWHDKLCETIFYYRGTDNGDKIHMYLSYQFGTPDNMLPDAKDGDLWKYWKRGDTLIFFTAYNYKKDEGTIAFHSVSIMNEQQGY